MSFSTASTTADDLDILPASCLAGVTDAEIAMLYRFLFRSTEKGGHPLKHPRRSLDDGEFNNSTHAPLRGVSGFNRSRLLLDALVAVCIFTRRQCLALSVTFGMHSVRITIAQNNETPSPRISVHLSSVWQQLRALASLQKRLRQDYNLPNAPVGQNGTSPGPVESHLPSAHAGFQALKRLKEILHRDIHRHCYMKTKQRVKKYLLSYNVFNSYYERNQGTLDSDETILMVVFHLNKIYQTVTQYQGPLDGSGAPTLLDWDHLAKQSSLLHRAYTKNKANVTERIISVMESWRETPDAKRNTLRGFDLWRAVEMLVALPSHIQELINFAYSPRLRPFLDNAFDIVLLHPVTVDLPEPSLTDIKDAVTRAFNATSFAQRRQKDTLEVPEVTLADQLDLVAGTLTPPVSTLGVHAEYALLLHHHETRSASEAPFRYIAVSKLSCFCCWNLYQGYSRATSRRFSLRGSHSKLNFPWAAATDSLSGAGATIRNYLYSKLVNLYSTHLTRLDETYKRLSDSSGASHESVSDDRGYMDSEDEAEAKAEAKASIEARRRQ